MSEREPSADELLAMAYADGELLGTERAHFEQRLAAEPALAREVAQLKRLEVLARHAAPPEPMDHEWERLARSGGQRGLWSAGWLFFGAGVLGLAAWDSTAWSARRHPGCRSCSSRSRSWVPCCSSAPPCERECARCATIPTAT